MKIINVLCFLLAVMLTFTYSKEKKVMTQTKSVSDIVDCFNLIGNERSDYV